MPPITREELLAKLAAKKAALQISTSQTPSAKQISETSEATWVPKYFTSKGFPLNQQQSAAVDLAASHQSFCLIGAAGTGKTTTLREVVLAVSRNLPQGTAASDAIVCCAFTRRAVANARKALGDIGLDGICKTIHKTLRYRRFKEEYFDENGELKNKFYWGPSITALTPNYSVQLIIIEEASMVGYGELYKELREGFPEATFIFVGDLNQLKPVFGDSCLGFKLNTVPVIELTEVYRQAMDSPIIAFQHNFTLRGRIPTTAQLQEISLEKKGLLFLPIQRRKENPEDVAYRIFNSWILPQLRNGDFNPDEDMILCPNNAGVGQLTFNAYLAQYLSAEVRKVPTWEIDCGMRKQYLAVGDLVQADKRDGIIVEIFQNGDYEGNPTIPPSLLLDRFGKYHGKEQFDLSLLEFSGDPITGNRAIQNALDKINGADVPSGEAAERKRQASHTVSIQWLDAEEGDEPANLSTVGEVASIQLNYAMTVHRSQGSEWRKVILILHYSAGGLLCRESFYTGMTRARESLEVLYSPNSSTNVLDNTVARCISKASIPGKLWSEKAKHFAGKWENQNWIDPSDEEWRRENARSRN